jgi:hypothetical protein
MHFLHVHGRTVRTISIGVFLFYMNPVIANESRNCDNLVIMRKTAVHSFSFIDLIASYPISVYHPRLSKC